MLPECELFPLEVSSCFPFCIFVHLRIVNPTAARLQSIPGKSSGFVLDASSVTDCFGNDSL